MSKKQMISALLCIFMIMAMVFGAASCSDSNDREKNSDFGEENPDLDFGRADAPDGLPADLKFGGQSFTILSRNESQFLFGYEMGVEAENGDIVNDAIYRRNKAVEERLDVSINVVKIPGIWGYETSFNDNVRNSVKAGDNAYDLVAGFAATITPMAVEGIFANWKNVPYIAHGSPWWIEKLADEMTIDGKNFFISGDLSLTMISSMMVVFFNKNLKQDYNIEKDLYQTVLEGKWTYDRFYDICKSVYNDANGDGVKNEGDIFGLAIEMGNPTEQMFVTMNQPFSQKDENGDPYFTLNSAKTQDILDKIITLFYDNPGVYSIPEGEDSHTNDMFKSGESLFYTGTLEVAEYLRDMKDDFGIIPSPKYDEAQDKYTGHTQASYSLFCIPGTVENPQLVGAVTEAMAAESYRHLTPAYYESALKIKYARDDITSQMLDIIREGIHFDFASINSFSLNYITFLIRNLVLDKNRNFVSAYEREEPAYERALAAIIDAYRSLD